MKQLNIFRGAPGSGKSTFAKTFEGVLFEADQWHMVGNEYAFDFGQLYMAHVWCTKMVEESAKMGLRTVNVANTFIKRKDLKPYLKIAETYGYNVTIYCMKSDYGSIHDVPLEKVASMRIGLQPIEGEKIIGGKHE